MKPIEALAEILRKAQGKTCAESGQDIDIGAEVMHLRGAINSAMMTERTRCALVCDAQRIVDVEGDWDRGYNMALVDCNVAILSDKEPVK